MQKEPDDFQSRKEHRRNKIKHKSSYRDSDYDDPIERKAKKHNSDIKKIKEEIDEEEWEDWDRYYNH